MYTEILNQTKSCSPPFYFGYANKNWLQDNLCWNPNQFAPEIRDLALLIYENIKGVQLHSEKWTSRSHPWLLKHGAIDLNLCNADLAKMVEWSMAMDNRATAKSSQCLFEFFPDGPDHSLAMYFSEIGKLLAARPPPISRPNAKKYILFAVPPSTGGLRNYKGWRGATSNINRRSSTYVHTLIHRVTNQVILEPVSA